jgi:hypothetical protein
MKKTWAEEFAAILGTDYQETNVLAPRLRQADTDKVMRLMPTNMPPRPSKSKLVSITYAAWVLGVPSRFTDRVRQ